MVRGSSVVEHLVHTQEVARSIRAPATIFVVAPAASADARAPLGAPNGFGSLPGCKP